MARVSLDHLPQLNPLELEAFLQRLDQTGLSAEGKTLIRQMFTAASTGQAETPTVVIQALPKPRRDDIRQTVEGVGAVLTSVTKRGGDRLNALTDEQWAALVAEANADAP